MAQFVPLKSSVALRLNLGADPESGKAVHRAVSISRVSPDLTAEQEIGRTAKSALLTEFPAFIVIRG